VRELALVGDKELIAALKKYGAAAAVEVEKAITKTAINIHSDAVKSVSRAGSGRLYKRGPGRNLSATHRASKPGDPPAKDTGRLVSSLVWKMDGDSALVGSSITNPPYPMWLEFGTQNMEPRPFLGPALEKNTDKFMQRLKDIHGKAIR
jgi:HK97 gp10 family phage protein